MGNSLDKKVMLDVKGVMDYVGIGRDNAYHILKDCGLPTLKIGKKRLIHQEVLDKWLQSHKAKIKKPAK